MHQSYHTFSFLSNGIVIFVKKLSLSDFVCLWRIFLLWVKNGDFILRDSLCCKEYFIELFVYFVMRMQNDRNIC